MMRYLFKYDSFLLFFQQADCNAPKGCSSGSDPDTSTSVATTGILKYTYKFLLIFLIITILVVIPVHYT